ncbi:MAG: NAD(P)H-dependent oxidoreductase subunit E, partial [Rhodoferax sp.]|nr:NAD(P)H-dependent oxidoreductase subunit E [Rhodoferax sp.]
MKPSSVGEAGVIAVASVDELRDRIRRKRQLKGRQSDALSVDEVRSLIGPRPTEGYRRDLLIEHLHKLNDAWRGLHERHLVALAQETNIPMAEVYEVATFYHHFEVLKGGATAPALTVRVCDGLSCEMAGAQGLLAQLPALLGRDDVRVIPAPCLGRCEQAPVAVVHQNPVLFATPQRVCNAVAAGRTQQAPAVDTRHFDAASFAEKALSPMAAEVEVSPAYAGYATYRAHGGYALAAALVNGEDEGERIIAIMEQSGLRGLGGA